MTSGRSQLGQEPQSRSCGLLCPPPWLPFLLQLQFQPQLRPATGDALPATSAKAGLVMPAVPIGNLQQQRKRIHGQTHISMPPRQGYAHLAQHPLQAINTRSANGGRHSGAPPDGGHPAPSHSPGRYRTASACPNHQTPGLRGSIRDPKTRRVSFGDWDTWGGTNTTKHAYLGNPFSPSSQRKRWETVRTTTAYCCAVSQPVTGEVSQRVTQLEAPAPSRRPQVWGLLALQWPIHRAGMFRPGLQNGRSH